jgi:hypothetical protein
MQILFHVNCLLKIHVRQFGRTLYLDHFLAEFPRLCILVVCRYDALDERELGAGFPLALVRKRLLFGHFYSPGRF